MRSIRLPSAALHRGQSIPRLVNAAAATLAMALAAGCDGSSKIAPTGEQTEQPPLTVAVVRPERTTLRLLVRQPGTIEAYEQTRIFAKVAGYVRKWPVDIGDAVHKGDLLAELWVPEMEMDVKQKEALVQQAEAEITQAQEAAAAAEKSFLSAEAKVKEAEAARLRAQAELKQTKSRHARLSRAGQSGVIDKEQIEETLYGFEAAQAGMAEVEAKIKAAEAERDKSKAQWDKAKADVVVADAHLAVARANRDLSNTMLQYTRLTAPYDGVITRRNINTDDFVQPATGPKGEPLYVVERRDKVRLFLDVPEAAAGWVRKGAKAHIRVQVLKGPELDGEVARTSYALDRTARTLVAEIDLDNPKDQLRPGMYVAATITADRPDVMSLPVSAILTQGDVTQGYQSYCFLVEDGQARRAGVEIGTRGTDRVEVLRKQARSAKSATEGNWEEFTGQETVIQGDLSALSDGQTVSIAPNPR
jgi:multidrug efflux pump subunit AcrA (membrane-fusion protein)